ncbi:MAG: AraC family transcriptional regulator [Nitrososphaerota archaeon]|jgi:ribosomal protein S14|nr:AraC family transcriptional regulator [Nitrososphaerota archaeon]
MKNCVACGMPMNVSSDFAMNDETRNYCVHCARSDGTMKSFDEIKEGMTNFIIQTQGLSREAAENAALLVMKNLPTWKSHFV